MKFISGLLVTSKAKSDEIVNQMNQRYKVLKINKHVNDESGIEFLIFSPKNVNIQSNLKSHVYVVDESNPFIVAKEKCEKIYEELSKSDEVKFTDGVNIMTKDDYVGILDAFIRKTENFNKMMQTEVES